MSIGRGMSDSQLAPRPLATRSPRSGSDSGSGTSVGGGSLCSRPSWCSWNDADSAKIASPRWMASTRRVVKERPSRTRSVS